MHVTRMPVHTCSFLKRRVIECTEGMATALMNMMNITHRNCSVSRLKE